MDRMQISMCRSLDGRQLFLHIYAAFPDALKAQFSRTDMTDRDSEQDLRPIRRAGFPILPKRARVSGLQDIAQASSTTSTVASNGLTSIFVTCCILHNMLLIVDRHIMDDTMEGYYWERHRPDADEENQRRMAGSSDVSSGQRSCLQKWKIL